MKNLPLLFCGIFFMLAFSFTGIIVTGNNQIGALERTTETLAPSDDDPSILVPIAGDPLFPRKMSGIAEQGKQVYIELDAFTVTRSSLAAKVLVQTLSVVGHVGQPSHATTSCRTGSSWNYADRTRSR